MLTGIQGAYYEVSDLCRGWVEFFGGYQNMVCRKQLWTPGRDGFEGTNTQLDPLWKYVRVFNSTQCEFWAEEIELEDQHVPRWTRRASPASA